MFSRYQGGATLQEVGDEFGVTRERVRQILKAAGYSTEEARKTLARTTRCSREEEAVTRLHGGATIQSVAQSLDMTVSAVRALAKKFAPSASEDLRKGSRVPNGYWTKERILDAIRAWADTYGSPPHATDWNVAALRARDYKEREERFLSGLWPHLTTVQSKFGNWNQAIEAAGLEPTPVSSYGRPGDDAEIVAEAIASYRNGLSLGQAASKAGISTATLERHLVNAGVALPAEVRVPEMEQFLEGRDWTLVSTVAERIKHGGSQVYRVVRERSDLFELLEISERGLHVRLKRKN
jgi:Homing endonuclease associated repeat/Sigma-70, region 4/helix-turn-helix, Psq domain